MKFCKSLVLLLGTCVWAQHHSESFQDFFLEFRESSEYQVSRIVFPLPSVSVQMEKEWLDSVMVTREQWKYNDFSLIRSGIQVREYDNFARKLRPSGERVISLVGSDNGLLYSYFFKLIEGRWWLVRILDESS